MRRGEAVDLLFKFITFREFTYSENVEASAHIIKPRHVTIRVMEDRRIKTSLKVHIMPNHAPIDHVFRFYEPE